MMRRGRQQQHHRTVLTSLLLIILCTAQHLHGIEVLRDKTTTETLATTSTSTASLLNNYFLALQKTIGHSRYLFDNQRQLSLEVLHNGRNLKGKGVEDDEEVDDDGDYEADGEAVEDDTILSWDDEIEQPDEKESGGDEKEDEDNESEIDDKNIEWDDEIAAKDDDKKTAKKEKTKEMLVDNQRPPKSTWFDTQTGEGMKGKVIDKKDTLNDDDSTAPSSSSTKSLIPHDSIISDILMGFAFAALFTVGIILLGYLINLCFTYLFCPEKLKKKRWRMRYRMETMGVGGIFIPLRNLDSYYAPVSTRDEDAALVEEGEESDEDEVRLEYGIAKKEQDDDDDYSFGAKRDGRYESEEIDKAADDYFGKEEGAEGQQQQEEEDDSDGEHEKEVQEDLLDLEAMEKKIAKKIEDSKFV